MDDTHPFPPSARSFRLLGPQRAVSDDGVTIQSVGRSCMRYALPDRHCDLYREAVAQGRRPAGAAIAVSAATLWQMADGSTTAVTDQEREAIRADFVAAWQVLGSPTYGLSFD